MHSDACRIRVSANDIDTGEDAARGLLRRLWEESAGCLPPGKHKFSVMAVKVEFPAGDQYGKDSPISGAIAPLSTCARAGGPRSVFVASVQQRPRKDVY
jgi:hypothetical protein